jgi:hypothetical protein
VTTAQAVEVAGPALIVMSSDPSDEVSVWRHDVRG